MRKITDNQGYFTMAILLIIAAVLQAISGEWVALLWVFNTALWCFISYRQNKFIDKIING